MISFDIKKVKIVPLEQVRPNTWNPKVKDTAQYRLIKDDIERNGQKVPAVVRENKGLELIDGEQRWTALKELGETHIVINNIGKVSDTDAKNETLWYQLQVPMDTVLLAPLVLELKQLDIQLPLLENDIEELSHLDKLDLGAMLKDQPKDQQTGDVRTLVLAMAKDKYDFICGALDAVIAQEGLQPNDRSRALELIVADYISGK